MEYNRIEYSTILRLEGTYKDHLGRLYFAVFSLLLARGERLSILLDAHHPSWWFWPGPGKDFSHQTFLLAQLSLHE